MNGLKWNTSSNFCSSKTIIPSFYTSQASTDQPLCFKRLIMASYQSVVNRNIIMELELNGKHHLLVYADDVNMLAENLQTIRENTEIFIKASKDIGLEVNSDKSKYMITSRQ